VEEDQAVRAEWLFTDAKNMLEVHVRYWDSRPEYIGWEKLGIEVELTDDQLLLCTSAVWCYDLLEQKSMLASSSDLQPVDWNKSAMNHLVLDQDKKDLICAVVKNHSKDSPSQTQDIIEGKGSVSRSCSSFSALLISVRALLLSSTALLELGKLLQLVKSISHLFSSQA
jgi:hypothetical protein